MTAELAKQLSTRLDVEVSELRQLTGGASRETWSFDADGRRLILRRDPPGDPRAAGMAREAAAIAAAARAGVPVPPLVDASSDPAVLGAPYLITGFVDGETIARKLLREQRYAAARAGLAVELGRTLARIHTVPIDDIPHLEAADPMLGDLQESYDALHEPLPAVEIALRWLDANRPDPVPDAVVHGDFRMGNLIIDESGLQAVLDWELVHRGDPREDLGWVCVKAWRFGSPLPVGGCGTIDDLLDGYAEVAGTRPDPAAVHWWLVRRTVWWAIGCRRMAERHLSGEPPSVELAAIGRRVCEQEHDLLLALGVPAEPVPAIAVAPASDLHGHPSAAELVAAVAMFLREDVMAGTDGRLNFLARVAAGVLDGVHRELRLGPEQERRHRARLATLGRLDQAELAAAIRAGALDADDPAVLAVVRAGVTDRLTVANPKYLLQP